MLPLDKPESVTWHRDMAHGAFNRSSNFPIHLLRNHSEKATWNYLANRKMENQEYGMLSPHFIGSISEGRSRQALERRKKRPPEKDGGSQGPGQTWSCRYLEAVTPELWGGTEIPEEATVEVGLVPGYLRFMEKSKMELMRKQNLLD